jgi:hypothetical protein
MLGKLAPEGQHLLLHRLRRVSSFLLGLEDEPDQDYKNSGKKYEDGCQHERPLERG